MDKFNTNNSSLDCSALEDLFVRQGTLKEFARNDYFLRQNDHTRYIGYVVSGMFRLSRVDANANEWIIGYSFEHDFVCDYPALRQGSEASVNIQAAVDSSNISASLGKSECLLGNGYGYPTVGADYCGNNVF